MQLTTLPTRDRRHECNNLRLKVFNYDNNNAHTWITFVVEIIVVIDLLDVKVVVVTPLARPTFRIFEPIPSILETVALAALLTAALHVKSVFTPKAGMEAVIANLVDDRGPVAGSRRLLCFCSLAFLSSNRAHRTQAPTWRKCSTDGRREKPVEKDVE
jgi:hypothetical protein